MVTERMTDGHTSCSLLSIEYFNFLKCLKSSSSDGADTHDTDNPTTTQSANNAAANAESDAVAEPAAADAGESTGADTHTVGFEGARDQVIVIPKKL